MKINEVSQKFDLSQDTLRYYERIGLIQPVRRSPSGIRDYGPADLQRIEFIKCMRRAGIPVEALIEYVALFHQGDDTVEARKEILRRQRDRLQSRMAEMQETLDVLNYKISAYESTLLEKERQLARQEE